MTKIRMPSPKLVYPSVMKRARNPQIGLDSQCLSYMLDAIEGIDEPTDSLASEKKALLRSWVYKPGTFTLTETVMSEVGRISNIERRKLHESFIGTHFIASHVRDHTAIQARAGQFQLKHPPPNNCRILAEAEELGLDIVLTYDDNFWKRLHAESPTTKLMKPSAYWLGLRIPRGAEPITVPLNTNPLSQQTWWLWEHQDQGQI